MILLVHLLFGATVGAIVNNIYVAIALSFLSHYFLDIFPHIEYPIENIKKKQWRKAAPDILRVFLDFCSGILLIFIFSKNQPIVYVCALIGLIPDALTALNYLVPNKILNIHDRLHQKIHFLGEKKISAFWRVLSQLLVVLISVWLIILR